MPGGDGENFRADGSGTGDVERRIAKHPGAFDGQFTWMMQLCLSPGRTSYFIPFKQAIAEAAEAEVMIDAEVTEFHSRPSADVAG